MTKAIMLGLVLSGIFHWFSEPFKNVYSYFHDVFYVWTHVPRFV